MAEQLPSWASELVKVGSSRWESEYAAAIEATGMYRHDRANFAGFLIEECQRLRKALIGADMAMAKIDSGSPDYREIAAEYFRARESVDARTAKNVLQ